MVRGPAPTNPRGSLPHQGAIQQAFGQHDLSNARVHEQATSIHATGVKYNPKADPKYSTGAQSYATGQDIFFKEGAYNPGSTQGQSLIGHELTHVVQQRGGQ